jgi:hypothetical protein
MIFYLKFQVNITGGESFNGNAGGLSTPGGGALFGDVYTDNLPNLYANTVSFEFQGTPVYLSILFFDGTQLTRSLSIWRRLYRQRHWRRLRSLVLVRYLVLYLVSTPIEVPPPFENHEGGVSSSTRLKAD